MANAGPDLVDTFLSFLNHLDCLVPLLLKRNLCAFDFHFLDVHPTVDLLLFGVIRPWGTLVSFKQFLYVLLLLLFAHSQTVFSELNQLLVVRILHFLTLLAIGKLLECVAVEEATAGLANSVVHTKSVLT